MLLAGDIGGTKTNLAVVSPGAGPRAPLAAATYRSRDYADLETMARAFLAETGLSVERASFGVAGPVVDDVAEVTNLPWVVDAEALRARLGLTHVVLLNDLEAIAASVPVLTNADLHVLATGEPETRGAIAVIAPGTGLGEAFLTWDGRRYSAHPSEGGHAGFAPTNDLQDDLLRYLRPLFGRVSVERVCSGRGIPNIYAFLRDTGHAHEPPWLTEALAGADDPTPVIANAARDASQPCELCAATLDMFVAILGAEAGNLALKVLATGGIYLAGGIPPRILPALEDPRFLQAFRDKGRFADLMARIPVHVITNPKAALLGAAHHGLEVAALETRA